MHPTQKPATSAPQLPELPQRVETPADTLRHAALYLKRHGWEQGSYYGDTADPFPPACAAGAIRAVAFGKAIDTFDGYPDDPNTETVRVAERVLAAYLDREFDPFQGSALTNISDWNDEPNRTADEVVDLLTAAADDWDQAHNPADATQAATVITGGGPR